MLNTKTAVKTFAVAVVMLAINSSCKPANQYGSDTKTVENFTRNGEAAPAYVCGREDGSARADVKAWVDAASDFSSSPELGDSMRAKAKAIVSSAASNVHESLIRALGKDYLNVKLQYSLGAPSACSSLPNQQFFKQFNNDEVRSCFKKFSGEAPVIYVGLKSSADGKSLDSSYTNPHIVRNVGVVFVTYMREILDRAIVNAPADRRAALLAEKQSLDSRRSALRAAFLLDAANAQNFAAGTSDRIAKLFADLDAMRAESANDFLGAEVIDSYYCSVSGSRAALAKKFDATNKAFERDFVAKEFAK
jgi:hypothetical protein